MDYDGGDFRLFGEELKLRISGPSELLKVSESRVSGVADSQNLGVSESQTSRILG